MHQTYSKSQQHRLCHSTKKRHVLTPPSQLFSPLAIINLKFGYSSSFFSLFRSAHTIRHLQVTLLTSSIFHCHKILFFQWLLGNLMGFLQVGTLGGFFIEKSIFLEKLTFFYKIFLLLDRKKLLKKILIETATKISKSKIENM